MLDSSHLDPRNASRVTELDCHYIPARVLGFSIRFLAVGVEIQSCYRSAAVPDQRAEQEVGYARHIPLDKIP